MSFRSGKFFILKLHGDIDRLKSIVLTRDEYEKFLFNRRGQMLLDSLKQHLIYRTVLFIGFGLSDPHFLRVLGEAGWLAMGYQGEVFCIMANTSKPEREEWKRRSIHIIPISNHDELPIFLNKLADEVIE